ncbi:MAG: hypothetical protein J0L55_09770 [Caulobacterales bacterium]|nr:hypothetical protein [Caulobacterales bacterium]MCA0372401.1 hypothetical protein [Pseudomonadota bacterium]
MKPQKFFSIAHKYLALIFGFQIFLWVGSGLFFTIVPIEKIRGEDLIKDRANIALKDDDFTALNKILVLNPNSQKIELYSNSTGSIIRIGDDFFDGKSGIKRENISKENAISIANSALKKAQIFSSAELVGKESVEYKGEIPAWKVNYENGLSVYIGAKSGEIITRRTNLWRFYDTLWSLHIMDWKNHESFNHNFIRIVAGLAFLTVIFGIALIPYRVKFRRK